MKKIERTFIIDDDPIQCFLSKKILEDIKAFGSIESFPNGKVAFDEIVTLVDSRGNLPSLILLDLNMPVMDGWEFLQSIQSLVLHQKLSIYIVTSSIDKRDIDRAKQLGEYVMGYIIKPITNTKLKSALYME